MNIGESSLNEIETPPIDEWEILKINNKLLELGGDKAGLNLITAPPKDPCSKKKWCGTSLEDFIKALDLMMLSEMDPILPQIEPSVRPKEFKKIGTFNGCTKPENQQQPRGSITSNKRRENIIVGHFTPFDENIDCKNGIHQKEQLLDTQDKLLVNVHKKTTKRIAPTRKEYLEDMQKDKESLLKATPQGLLHERNHSDILQGSHKLKLIVDNNIDIPKNATTTVNLDDNEQYDKDQEEYVILCKSHNEDESKKRTSNNCAQITRNKNSVKETATLNMIKKVTFSKESYQNISPQYKSTSSNDHYDDITKTIDDNNEITELKLIENNVGSTIHGSVEDTSLSYSFEDLENEAFRNYEIPIGQTNVISSHTQISSQDDTKERHGNTMVNKCEIRSYSQKSESIIDAHNVEESENNKSICFEQVYECFQDKYDKGICKDSTKNLKDKSKENNENWKKTQSTMPVKSIVKPSKDEKHSCIDSISSHSVASQSTQFDKNENRKLCNDVELITVFDKEHKHKETKCNEDKNIGETNSQKSKYDWKGTEAEGISDYKKIIDNRSDNKVESQINETLNVKISNTEQLLTNTPEKISPETEVNNVTITDEDAKQGIKENAEVSSTDDFVIIDSQRKPTDKLSPWSSTLFQSVRRITSTILHSVDDKNNIHKGKENTNNDTNHTVEEKKKNVIEIQKLNAQKDKTREISNKIASTTISEDSKKNYNGITHKQDLNGKEKSSGLLPQQENNLAVKNKEYIDKKLEKENYRTTNEVVPSSSTITSKQELKETEKFNADYLVDSKILSNEAAAKEIKKTEVAKHQNYKRMTSLDLFSTLVDEMILPSTNKNAIKVMIIHADEDSNLALELVEKFRKKFNFRAAAECQISVLRTMSPYSYLSGAMNWADIVVPLITNNWLEHISDISSSSTRSKSSLSCRYSYMILRNRIMNGINGHWHVVPVVVEGTDRRYRSWPEFFTAVPIWRQFTKLGRTIIDVHKLPASLVP